MKKIILAIVQTTTRFVVRTLMLITPTRIQIHVFSRLIDACLAPREVRPGALPLHLREDVLPVEPRRREATDLPEDPNALIQDLNSTRGLGFARFNHFAIF